MLKIGDDEYKTGARDLELDGRVVGAVFSPHLEAVQRALSDLDQLPDLLVLLDERGRRIQFYENRLAKVALERAEEKKLAAAQLMDTYELRSWSHDLRSNNAALKGLLKKIEGMIRETLGEESA